MLYDVKLTHEQVAAIHDWMFFGPDAAPILIFGGPGNLGAVLVEQGDVQVRIADDGTLADVGDDEDATS